MGLDHGRQTTHSAATAWRTWLLPLAIIVASAVAELGGEGVREALRYAREPLQQGELWRLLSGHLVHLGWSHWLMNVIALTAIWLLVGRERRTTDWLIVLLIVLATMDAGFWWLDGQLRWYVGLSGLLHGLLLAGLLNGWRDRPLESLLLVGLLVCKLGYEQLAGPLPGSASAAGGPVVVNAHLYGAVGGLLAHIALHVSVGKWRSL